MTDELKPVAWMYELAGARSTNLDGSKSYTNWKSHITTVYPNVPVDGLRNLTPLYTAAQLVEERHLAWNEAIEAAGAVVGGLYLRGDPHQRHPLFIEKSIRALTKENSDG